MSGRLRVKIKHRSTRKRKNKIDEKVINFKSTCNPTTEDAYGQGPFYTPNAPNIINGQLAGVNEIGTRMIISGKVLNLDCSEVIPNPEIDIWHADND